MLERVTFYQIYFNDKSYPARLEFVSKDISEEVDKIISSMEQNQQQTIMNKEDLKKIISGKIETGSSEIELLIPFDSQDNLIQVKIKTMY